MDDKRKMQKILGNSLSGLQENPFLAQRVIAQAKGEKPVKRKISLAIVLCIVLGIAIIGTACALLASSQVADFFRQYWGQDMGDWLEEGKIAQVGESVTVGDVIFTLDEVVYRDRGIYGVGTAKPVDSKNVLVPMDLADDWSACFQNEEGKALISLAAATNGKLITVNCVPNKIGVDEGTMLTVNAGVYNVRNDDGLIIFSFEASGYALEDGTSYQMVLDYETTELTPDGKQVEGSFKLQSGTVSFMPVMVAEKTEEPESIATTVETIPQDGYEVIVPDEYRETGTLPYYQAVENDFTKIVHPEWFNQSGIMKEETDTGYAYYVFNDHAVLDVAPEYVGYREYTDEQFDYNWRAREVDDPNLEPAWGDKQAFSYSIAAVASFVNWGDDFAKDTVFEKKQLTYLSFEDADTSAKKMMDLLHLSGYELTWALDMDLDRIKMLGKAYNEHWYESGSGFTNSPRYDYDLATAEDEGYYLIYTQTSAAGLDESWREASFFITSRGIVYAEVRCYYMMGEKAEAPDTLITSEKTVERLYEEVARSRNGEKVVRIKTVELTLMPVRAENKQEGMVFAPVWKVIYLDKSGEKKGFDSWAIFNSVNGKLIDAIFR